jgi:hypothetical protein
MTLAVAVVPHWSLIIQNVLERRVPAKLTKKTETTHDRVVNPRDMIAKKPPFNTIYRHQGYTHLSDMALKTSDYSNLQQNTRQI